MKANGSVLLFIGLRELLYREVELGDQAPSVFARGVAACISAGVLAGIVAGLARPWLGAKAGRFLLGALMGLVYGLGIGLFALDPGDSITESRDLFLFLVPLAALVWGGLMYGMTIGRETAWPIGEPWM